MNASRATASNESAWACGRVCATVEAVARVWFEASTASAGTFRGVWAVK